MAIAKIWARQILAGNKSIDDVPAKLRNEVETILEE